MTISPCSLSMPDTFPQVKVIRPCLGSNRFARNTCSFNRSNMFLPEPIHGGSFNDEPLFVAFHERHKAIDIPLIGSYRRTIFACKELVGKISFEGFIHCLMEHIGGKQCNSPCAALTR